MNINIIGFGFVGKSVGNLLKKNNIEFNVYDINESYYKTLKDLVVSCEKKSDNVYFICVPTPSTLNGDCDTSIVYSVVNELSELISSESIIIIKSTIKPGTTRTLAEKFDNLNIIFCPEFLKEKSANDDMYNANFVLFGMDTKNEQLSKKLTNMFIKIYSHKQIECYIKSYEEAELFKYTVNTFLATKITFFNEINELCEKIGVDYQKLKQLFDLEPRIGTYGIEVPGPDGKFSFSGKCLPKEICGMIKLQENLELSSEFMKCVKKRGDDFRIKKVNYNILQ